jgi:methyl-accepting chemotaxis protein
MSDDTQRLFQSLSALSMLLLSSATVRLLLSDSFKFLRDYIARLAGNVEEVALHVQVAAEEVEKAMNTKSGGLPMVGAMAGEVVQTVESITHDVEKVSSEPRIREESARDAFISQIQEVRSHSSFLVLKIEFKKTAFSSYIVPIKTPQP